MKELNNLEKTILERLALKYPSLNYHIPFLEVASREVTGVGMYINFSYTMPVYIGLDLGEGNLSISTSESIVVNGLNHGLCFEVDISGDKVNFLELVTSGEEWDGDVSGDFSFQ